VYRRDCTVYYRRLDREEFLVLEALRAGKPIGEALEVCSEDLGPKVEQWFTAWSELGWLCAPEETTNA
jgi:Flp pilus assembly protein TadB